MRKYILSLFLLLLPFSTLVADPDSTTYFVEESFVSDGNCYLKLEGQQCFLIEKVLLRKASGWFDSDEYGSPCVRWLRGDRVSIYRSERYDFPFQIMNLQTDEMAWGIGVNFEREQFDKILAALNEISNDQRRLKNLQVSAETRLLKAIVDTADTAKEIQRDLQRVKDLLRGPGY